MARAVSSSVRRRAGAVVLASVALAAPAIAACADVIGLRDLHVTDAGLVAVEDIRQDAPIGVGDTTAPLGATWPVNGHRYLVVVEPDGISWPEAKARSEAIGGHLATITSTEENGFVFQLVLAAGDAAYASYEGPWLGGRQLDGATEPGSNWTWVTGEPFTFTSWANDEPNNMGGAENSLSYYSYPARRSTWSDAPEDRALKSFVVEFE